MELDEPPIDVAPLDRRPAATPVWLGVLVACVVIVALGLLVRAKWSPLLDLDHDVSDALVVRGSGSEVHLIRRVTDLGSGLTRVIVVGILISWLALLRRWRLVVFAVLAALLVSPVTQLLKAAFDRPRPGLPDTAFVAGLSFPSGHTSGAAMLGGVLVVITWSLAGPRPARLVLAVAVLLAAAVGYSRIALGAHFLTDVVAGWLLGIIVVVVLARACGIHGPRPGTDDRVSARDLPVVGA